ncbi:hypothetical protein MSAN_00499400 [Mycena sanguinolenta]|uniref:Uncharacterized protein n=1 Tax=Mycena sanguinolenta TaxID=230812 RepID=A0A8H7DH36_9AGAR|nr:hypothetical protein MSAN_00499400 [Mycena sanguinolenta]
MRVFLWILREAGAKDVPSFDHLRKIQKQIREEYGIPSIPCKSALGNVFFINDPRAIIAQVRKPRFAFTEEGLNFYKDWASPAVRAQMHVYPEIPEDGVVREIWHALKWRKDMDLDVLSPMYDAGSAHYYVNELARLKDGNFVVPVCWLIYRGKVHADAFAVSIDEAGNATIDDSKTVIIAATDLSHNYLDLQDKKLVPGWSDKTTASGHLDRMPNPKRQIAGGDPLYVTLVDFFGDDVSGNRSKSWNKHLNGYMTNRTLPRKLLQQEFHVHFVSTSPHASMAEQFQEFKTLIEDTHSNPVRIQDEQGKTTRFSIYCNCTPSDNPMQSEICGHIGGKGNKFCRKCHVGGTQEDKATADGYHALFEPGDPRTKENTLTELKKQVELACGGVAKRVQELQTQTSVKDAYTQYWIDQIVARAAEMRRENANASESTVKSELIKWMHDNEQNLLVGWTPEKLQRQGETKLTPLKRGVPLRPVELLKNTNAARALNFGEYSGDSEWMRCKTVVCESLDECSVGTWVFAKSQADENLIICGRLADILCNASGKSIVIVELFQLLRERHPHYGMPVLTRRDDETTFSILPTKNIKFDFNAQHDCFSAKCEASGIRAIMQEQVESDKTENFIVHTQLDRFILNMNSFHNPHLVRATISRDLWAPVPLFDNRKAEHDEFSARLRDTRASKAAKRQETVARKRARPTAAASDADELLQPPRKRGRRGRPAELTSRSSQPRRRTMNPTMVSAFHGGIIQNSPSAPKDVIQLWEDYAFMATIDIMRYRGCDPSVERFIYQSPELLRILLVMSLLRHKLWKVPTILETTWTNLRTLLCGFGPNSVGDEIHQLQMVSPWAARDLALHLIRRMVKNHTDTDGGVRPSASRNAVLYNAEYSVFNLEDSYIRSQCSLGRDISYLIRLSPPCPVLLSDRTFIHHVSKWLESFPDSTMKLTFWRQAVPNADIHVSTVSSDIWEEQEWCRCVRSYNDMIVWLKLPDGLKIIV